MRIQHNIAALNANRMLGANNNSVSKNLEKLSSGYKINRAGDDAAGLAISEKMRGQIRGLDQATNNANDGISLVQTAEGALNETTSILQRMKELATQASNGTYKNEVDRENITKELGALKTEIDRISTSTNFNKINLLDGSLDGSTSAKAASGVTVAGLDSVVFTGLEVGTTVKITTAIATKTDEANAATVTVDEDTGNVTITLTSGYDGTAAEAGTVTADTIAKALSDAKVGYTGTFKDIAIGADGTATGFDEDGKVGTAAALNITLTAAKNNSSGNALTLQIGATASSDQQVSLSIGDMSSKGLGVDNISVATQDDAKAALQTIADAIDKVSGTRADLGALQNRLEHTVNNLGVTSENLSSAESRIRDVDMAKEMMEMTKNNVLAQAAQSMLAQANQQPQNVLKLLQ